MTRLRECQLHHIPKTEVICEEVRLPFVRLEPVTKFIFPMLRIALVRTVMIPIVKMPLPLVLIDPLVGMALVGLMYVNNFSFYWS